MYTNAFINLYYNSCIVSTGALLRPNVILELFLAVAVLPRVRDYFSEKSEFQFQCIAK